MIYEEIRKEREAQLARYQSGQDDLWSCGEWAALVSHYSTRRIVGDLVGVNVQGFRADMVKVAALAVACIEAMDRKVTKC